MTTRHAHSHGPASPHPAQAAPWSILRMTVLSRLGAALAVSAGLWAVVLACDEVSMPAQLQFRDVTLGYDRHPAVHHLDGEVAPGALLAVVGPNGAGKSTLFRGLVGILKPLAGSIDLGGLDIRDIAYLPQTADIDRSFPISVFDFVGTGLWRTTGLFGGIGKAARDQIAQALAAVGLNGFENRTIGTLSGGQMQRMLFARVLLQDARLIVLDEPFNAIDAKTSADLLALVRRWHGEERTVLAALHDMDLVRANFPETLLLAREPVAWGATAEVLTAENLQEARRMCEAFDDSAAACAVDDCPRGRLDADDPRRADRALYRIRVHAPRAGRRHRAVARRRADRRVSDAAADEPGRRRHGACHPAGRGDRLPAVGT